MRTAAEIFIFKSLHSVITLNYIFWLRRTTRLNLFYAIFTFYKKQEFLSIQTHLLPLCRKLFVKTGLWLKAADVFSKIALDCEQQNRREQEEGRQLAQSHTALHNHCSMKLMHTSICFRRTFNFWLSWGERGQRGRRCAHRNWVKAQGRCSLQQLHPLESSEARKVIPDKSTSILEKLHILFKFVTIAVK